MPTPPTYSTSDTALAAYLKVSGYQLVDLTIRGRTGTFTFAGVPPDVPPAYFREELRVEPRTFHRVIRDLIVAIKSQSEP